MNKIDLKKERAEQKNDIIKKKFSYRKFDKYYILSKYANIIKQY